MLLQLVQTVKGVTTHDSVLPSKNDFFDKGGVGLVDTQKSGGFERLNDVEYIVGEWTRLLGLAEPDRYTRIKAILNYIRFIGKYADTVRNGRRRGEAIFVWTINLNVVK